MTTPERWHRALAIASGGFVGTLARERLLEAIGEQTVGLAIANLSGALALGVVCGFYRGRVSALRLFLATGGIASFTSWSSLALIGSQSMGLLIVVAAQALLGVLLAALGHMIGSRWARP